MSMICVICRDALTSNPVPGKEADWDGRHSSTLSSRIVVVGCGHAQHEWCLSKWMERSDACPFCNAKVSQRDFRRIYPLGDEELDHVPRIPSLQQELTDLQQQNADKDTELQFCRRMLEDEQTNSEVLRIEYACLESRVESMTNQIAELNVKVAESAAEATRALDIQIADQNQQIKLLKQKLKSADCEKASALKNIRLAHKHSTETQVLLDKLLNLNGEMQRNSTEIDDGEITVIEHESDEKYYIPTPRSKQPVGKVSIVSVHSFSLPDEDSASMTSGEYDDPSEDNSVNKLVEFD